MIDTKKEIEDALSKVMHPEIDNSLIKLGMIKDIKVEDDEVSVTLNLPFLNVPIKDLLISLIKEPIEKSGKKAKIEITEMNEEERMKFMQLAREGWKL